MRLLQPFDCHITVVRQNVRDMDGVDDVLEADRYPDALAGADLVVLALSLTPETEGIIGRGEFKLMEEHAWLVNVARGRHIVTDDLVDALRDGVIGGAGLDVTDPEPLPPTIRCGRCRTASSRRTSATRPRWRGRCSPSGSPPTCGASPRAPS